MPIKVIGKGIVLIIITKVDSKRYSLWSVIASVYNLKSWLSINLSNWSTVFLFHEAYMVQGYKDNNKIHAQVSSGGGIGSIPSGSQ